MKPWEKYQSGPWEQYQDKDTSGIDWEAIQSLPPEKGIDQKIKEGLLSGVRGVNTLAPAIAGLPVDTATNLANLAIAGYGTLKGGTEPPNLLPQQIGGSEWIKEKIEGGLGERVFTPPDPTDPTQQKIHMGTGILAAGALAPATSVKQSVANIARMTPAAAGAVIGKSASDDPLAPMAGMMMGALTPGAVSAIRSRTPPTDAFVKAHKAGYVVPPSRAKPSKTQQTVEGVAGPVPTGQRASVKNQVLTNIKAKRALGLPEDLPLSQESLNALRGQAGQIYEKAKNLGTFTVDKTFNSSLARIAKQNSAMAKELPGLVKKDVLKLVKEFSGKKTLSSEATVETIKQLRADSNAYFSGIAKDPGGKALAKAQGKIANQLEGLMERNIEKVGPQFLQEFRQARQTIAKSYSVEKALNPGSGNVDAVKMGRQLDKGAPFSGELREIAEFGRAFKQSAQESPATTTNLRAMDYAVPGLTAISTGNPAWLAAMGARPAMRAGVLSKPYQSMLAKVPPAKLNQIMALPKEAQAAAMASLLAEMNQSDSVSNLPSQ